ncbi:hypothetical protein WMY93_006693 [Mugilogobius chulae]|uniref:Uncharacterized protein n=1 Tax=Mugilogobius chulae TaxID=88201 RepID=A0AAW0PRW8_9GOBI
MAAQCGVRWCLWSSVRTRFCLVRERAACAPGPPGLSPGLGLRPGPVLAPVLIPAPVLILAQVPVPVQSRFRVPGGAGASGGPAESLREEAGSGAGHRRSEAGFRRSQGGHSDRSFAELLRSSSLVQMGPAKDKVSHVFYPGQSGTVWDKAPCRLLWFWEGGPGPEPGLVCGLWREVSRCGPDSGRFGSAPRNQSPAQAPGF